uniref:Reverse transcriptase zinc-binding domain-containing protein n=1 Tax=Setaria viridis TaxID=4556 RepID=A0A4V6DBE5_SETVI|nr:hypothetical protein SEVIR_2G241600v2 [Setaria viridis]
MVLPSYACVLCPHGSDETLFHLLLQCPFAQECWIKLGLFPDLQQDPFSIMASFKTQLQVPFFMEIIIIMCWCIWMSRNGFIFKGLQPHIEGALSHFTEIFTLVKHRVKEAWHQPMFEWLHETL